MTLSGERSGGGGAVEGEIDPPPSLHVLFNTARFDGHQNSDWCFCVEEVQTAEEAAWSSYFVGKGSTVANRGHPVAGYMSCGRLRATASARTGGET